MTTLRRGARRVAAPALVLLAIAALALPSFPSFARAQAAPADDTAAVREFARAVVRARVKLAAENGALWGRRLDTIPWLGVVGSGVVTSADPRTEGYSPAGAGLWRGPLPSGVNPANTSIEWAGRRWAMVRLPLPSDPLAADRLLVHELWHVAQPGVLPLPPSGEGVPGAALLDEAEGRTWLQLEWRALAAALEASGARRESALADALLFRARRYALATPEERERERLLDLAEGLAEYTAWTVAGGGVPALARRLREEAPSRTSFVRSFPYYTGPAYGLLLEARAGRGWTRRLAQKPDIQAVAAEQLGARGRALARMLSGQDTGGTAAAAERAGRRYGVDSLRAAEAARWTAQRRRLADLRARFVEGATLRLRPGALRITFDPGRQTPLGTDGTVMGALVWKADDGALLDAPEGGLVAADWSEVRVPLDATAAAALTEGALAAPLDVRATGWRLSLQAGWRLSREGRDWVARPPSGR